MQSIQQFLQKPWLYLVIILIGVSLKFYHVNYRYFWFDEISTIQHTSGNQVFYSTVNEIKNITFFTDQLHLKTQNQTLGSQLKGLYSSTNLNPLHYTFLMVWYRIVGDSDRSYRYFNVFVFLLTLPVLFLLAKLLFNSSITAWIIVSLYAISPFIHWYVHEARYNILLLFMVSLAHYLLLKSCREKKVIWWLGYAIIAIFSLYASVMSGLILLGHLVYILFFKKDQWIPFGLSGLAVILAYLPWILSMIQSSNEIVNSLAWHTFDTGKFYFLRILPFQFTGFSNAFVNLTTYSGFRLIFYNFEGFQLQFLIQSGITVILLIAIVYAFKRAPGKTAFFLILIILPHWLFYYISDVIRNAGASVYSRYQALNYIGIFLFVSYFLGRKIEKGKYFYSTIILFLTIIGIISISKISQDKCWQIPLDCSGNTSEAKLFSEAENPLLISDFNMRYNTGIGAFLAILNRCESENIDVLHSSPDIKNVEEKIVDKDYSEIYVTHASDELVQNLKSQFGERMDSLEIEGINPTWKIQISNPGQ